MPCGLSQTLIVTFFMRSNLLPPYVFSVAISFREHVKCLWPINFWYSTRCRVTRTITISFFFKVASIALVVANLPVIVCYHIPSNRILAIQEKDTLLRFLASVLPVVVTTFARKGVLLVLILQPNLLYQICLSFNSLVDN